MARQEFPIPAVMARLGTDADVYTGPGVLAGHHSAGGDHCQPHDSEEAHRCLTAQDMGARLVRQCIVRPETWLRAPNQQSPPAGRAPTRLQRGLGAAAPVIDPVVVGGEPVSDTPQDCLRPAVDLDLAVDGAV